MEIYISSKALQNEEYGNNTNLIYFLIPGLTDDDLRETAYEILVASAGAAGYTFDILGEHLFMLLTNPVYNECFAFQWNMCLCIFFENILLLTLHQFPPSSAILV